MKTRLVFLDTSILDTVAQDPVLLDLLGHPRRNRVRGVVSLYQWFEISSDRNERRRNARVAVLDVIRPLWLKHVIRLKREYVAYRFFRFMHLPAKRPYPFSRTFNDALAAETGRRSQSPITLTEGVGMAAMNPALFTSVRQAGMEWVRASAWLQANAHLADRAPAIVSERFIRRRIPERSPTGLTLDLDWRTVDDFVARFDWRRIPEFALEAAIYRTNMRWPRQLDASEASDLMAATSAMLHCDAMVHDKRIVELVRRVQGSVPWGLARAYRHRDLTDLVDWLRQSH